jgi:low temperature requirement protein LtrA
LTGFSRLLEPPRLRTAGRGIQDDRRATWLELFFDLVFVAAVGQLANSLIAEPTTARFFEFLGLFVPVWWAWMGFTFYANRFDTDDLPYRLLSLLAMFGVAALAIELLTPIPAWRLLRDAPVHPRHLPERFGLLTLIVLGESVFAVVVGVSEVSWDVGSAVAAAAGFLVAAALWWIYFDFLDEGALTARGIFGGLTYTYMHYFVVVGLAALGAGVKLAILAAGGDHRYDETSWLLSAGLAMTMVGLAVIQLVTGTVVLDADVWLRLGTAALALVLVPLAFSPLAVVLIFAGALVAQVVYELARHERHAETAGI